MKQYLFYDEKREKTIFQNKINWLFGIFAVFMFSLAFVVIMKDSFVFLLLVLIGIFYFPGIPLVLKYYKKAYYIELLESYIVCSGKPNNLFGKTKIMHEDIFYVETGRREPVICPRGTTREQMVKEFGGFVNVYNKDRKYLFSLRDNSLMMGKLLEKNHNIKVVECLDEYSF